MVNINTNLSSLIVQNNLTQSTNALNTAIERMTTGYKINHSSDNAANYSIANNYNSKLSSLQVAEDNAMMGTDLVETASSTLDSISNHLTRIRDLAEQASNGTYGADSLSAIQAEVDSRISEINRIVANCEYNGINLLQSDEYAAYGNFMQPVTRLSQEEAEAEGYICVTTAEEFVQNIQQSGKKVILMNDIDFSDYTGSGSSTFCSTINGNGYELQNIDLQGPAHRQLLNVYSNLDIINLGITNLIPFSGYYPIENYYGGINITNSYFLSSNTSEPIVWAEAGEANYVYSNGDIILNHGSYNNSYIYTGAYGVGEYNYRDNPTEDEREHGGYISTAEVVELIKSGDLPYSKFILELAGVSSLGSGSTINLQVGINGDNSSQINFDMSLSLDLGINVSSNDSARNALSLLDEQLNKVSTKQTELGAVQNRLDSVIESIGVSIENLTSSLSTIKDADIAQESSAYIKAQILQQASATLLATANQSPSIALQLI